MKHFFFESPKTEAINFPNDGTTFAFYAKEMWGSNLALWQYPREETSQSNKQDRKISVVLLQADFHC